MWIFKTTVRRTKEEEEKKNKQIHKQTHHKYTLDSTYLPTIIIHTTVTKNLRQINQLKHDLQLHQPNSINFGLL